MSSKSSENIAQTLRDFVDNVGIPNTLICDLATEQVGPHTPMMKEICHMRIKMHNAEKVDRVRIIVPKQKFVN
jgi:hypothetical protein